MFNKKKQTIFIGVFIFLLLLGMGTIILYSTFKKVKKSDLHGIVDKMRAVEGDWKIPKDIPFPKDSAEMLFLQGLEKHGKGEYEEAGEIFERVISKKGKDPSLSGYTYFFLNETIYALTGVGDPELIEKMMMALTLYEPFKEEVLWTAALTIAYEPQIREKAMVLLEDYLKIHPDLSVENWSAIKNSIAMIEYMEGNYSKSIRDFYDVWIRLEKKILNERLGEELTFAKEYIANIYHLFEDYEGAIELYKGLIAEGIERNSSSIYSHYINLSTAYIKLGNLEEAKRTIQELEVYLPKMEEKLRAEIEGSMLDVLANIAMEERDYEEARVLLEKAMELYRQSDSDIFYGGWYYIELSYCKLLVHEGNYGEGIRRLEEMNESGIARQYTIERDVFETLILAYERTGNLGKQIDILRKQLQSEMEQEANIKKEYLDFSKYYGDANRLQNTNVSMLKNNIISFWIICFCVIAYMIIAAIIRRVKESKEPAGPNIP